MADYLIGGKRSREVRLHGARVKEENALLTGVRKRQVRRYCQDKDTWRPKISARERLQRFAEGIRNAELEYISKLIGQRKYPWITFTEWYVSEGRNTKINTRTVIF